MVKKRRRPGERGKTYETNLRIIISLANHLEGCDEYEIREEFRDKGFPIHIKKSLEKLNRNNWITATRKRGKPTIWKLKTDFDSIKNIFSYFCKVENAYLKEEGVYLRAHLVLQLTRTALFDKIKEEYYEKFLDERFKFLLWGYSLSNVFSMIPWRKLSYKGVHLKDFIFALIPLSPTIFKFVFYKDWVEKEVEDYANTLIRFSFLIALYNVNKRKFTERLFEYFIELFLYDQPVPFSVTLNEDQGKILERILKKTGFFPLILFHYARIYSPFKKALRDKGLSEQDFINLMQKPNQTKKTSD